MKRLADTGANRAARYSVRDEAIRRIATANPGLSSATIAARVGCGRRVVQRVVKAMAQNGRAAASVPF